MFSTEDDQMRKSDLYRVFLCAVYMVKKRMMMSMVMSMVMGIKKRMVMSDAGTNKKLNQVFINVNVSMDSSTSKRKLASKLEVNV